MPTNHTAEKAPKPEPDWESLARAQTADINAKMPELFFSFREDHAADVAAWSFECKRFGDFLSVFIKRRDQRHVSAINLMASKEIELLEGHGPDLLGEVGFFAHKLSSRPDPEAAYEVTHQATPSLPSLSNLIHNPDDWSRPLYRTFLVDSPAENGRMNYGSSSPAIAYKVPNAARPAREDRIVFKTSGTLFTPAGLGQQTYEQILSELGKEP